MISNRLVLKLTWQPEPKTLQVYVLPCPLHASTCGLNNKRFSQLYAHTRVVQSNVRKPTQPELVAKQARQGNQSTRSIPKTIAAAGVREVLGVVRARGRLDLLQQRPVEAERRGIDGAGAQAWQLRNHLQFVEAFWCLMRMVVMVRNISVISEAKGTQ